MILGIGCDIVKISRIQRMLDDYGDVFKRRIFTDVEIAIEKNDPACYYAKRFAAKEAYAKAAGSGIGELLSFKDIEVLYNNDMKPYFSNNERGAHLSMADEDDFAIAYVIIEG